MKTWKQFGALAAILGIIAGFTACDNGNSIGDDTTHIHQWGAWTTTATCTADGVETRVCALDATHVETRPAAALGHDWGAWTVITPVTCTADGVETRLCNHDATHTETRVVATALGHDWQWVQTGYSVETETCTRCSATNGTRSKTYSLGDPGPGGGKIFYVSVTGFTMTDNGQMCHYLEAAPVDMSSTLEWASFDFTSTDITGTETAIGTGRKNTALILATDANAPAAKACNSYNNNTLVSKIKVEKK